MDFFQFTLPGIATYPPPSLWVTFETVVSGGMDTVIELYAADGTTLLGINDDAAGLGYGSRIGQRLSAGTYFVKVRHYFSVGTGDYMLTASVQH